MSLPTGTVTFLFTDIEGSTLLWERYPEAMRLALERHDAVLKAVLDAHNGYVFKTVGDAFCAAFPTALQAVRAAVEAHLALSEVEWAATGPLRVRIGIHTGSAQERDNDYFGPTLNRTARLQGVGHGQQTLLTQTTYELVQTQLTGEVTLSDLGMHRFKDLADPEHVWQVLHPALPQEFPPLKSLNYLSTNLPQQLTSFLGREQEVKEVRELLATTRLLTLTGSGGTGKTRLAAQVGAEVLEQYADGVWWVELAPLSDPGLVPQTVADTLDIREAPGATILPTLIAALKERQMLLILDNCEHLLHASARLVDALLRSCPKMKILASSREALGTGGESAYRVPSLSVPEDSLPQTPQSAFEYAAVRLFVERATAVKSDFEITPQNATVLASICRRLDGIPLAIELAAARVRSLPVEEINARLDNRFRLLTGGSRTALPRQQTLRALIDWSYDLLNAQEKTLLLRLSVFAGGWTLDAAEAVCADNGIEEWEMLDLLTSLVDKSLVVYQEKEGRGRFRLLETVRQYARERLDQTEEAATVRDRHRDYFLALAEEAEPKLEGAEQTEWYGRLDEELENLRASLEWSLPEEGASKYQRLCGALSRFWWNRSHYTESREWCDRGLTKEDAQRPTPERAKTLNCAGGSAFYQSAYAAARGYYEASLEIQKELGDKRGIGRALHNLGNVASDQGDFVSARTYHEQSLTLKKETGDKSGIASSLNNLGNVVSHLGDNALAIDYYRQSLLLFRELGNRNGIAHALHNLGNMTSQQGDYAGALAYLEESLTLRKEIGERNGIAFSLHKLGIVAFEQGDYVSARAYYQESLAIRKEIGNPRGIAQSLNNLGNLAAEQKEYAAAQNYYAESSALFGQIKDKAGMAHALNNWGGLAALQGDYLSARTYHTRSLLLSQETGLQIGIACCLEAFVEHAARESRWEEVAVLWSAVEALRRQIGVSLPPHERARYDQMGDAARQALGEEAFTAAIAKGRAMPQNEVIALALRPLAE